MHNFISNAGILLAGGRSFFMTAIIERSTVLPEVTFIHMLKNSAYVGVARIDDEAKEVFMIIESKGIQQYCKDKYPQYNMIGAVV